MPPYVKHVDLKQNVLFKILVMLKDYNAFVLHKVSEKGHYMNEAEHIFLIGTQMTSA